MTGGGRQTQEEQDETQVSHAAVYSNPRSRTVNQAFRVGLPRT